MRYIIIVITLSLSIFIHWYNEPAYVQDNPLTIEELVDDVEAIDKAALKMGPYYNYVIEPDGTLKVNTGDGKELTLKY
jgi:hypothetical protein